MKSVTGECSSCESTYQIEYEEELVSEEYPEVCPFCGEQIEEITESQYIEDDDSDIDDDEWTN
jgi:transcription initiation factor IIE alpha subunit